MCVQADSGYDEGLYSQLAAAPLVLLDGRAKASSEHAGFDQLQAAGGGGMQAGEHTFGRMQDANN
jgi:hypothetical protein